MLNSEKIGIIIYIVLIMISLIIMTAIHAKAKKSSTLNYLTACQISVVIWLFCAVIENLAKGTGLYPHIVKKIIIILYYYGPLWLLFTFDYLKAYNFKTYKWRWIIFAPATATTLLTLINPDSPLIISDFDGVSEVRGWGIIFMLNALLTFIFVLASSVMIINNALKKRWMVKENILLVLSALIPIPTSTLFYTKVIGSPGFDVTPISLSVFIAVSAILIFRTKLFDVLPFAVHEVFYSINEAVVITDINGAVVAFNPAFEKLFAPYFDVRSLKDMTELSNGIIGNFSDHGNTDKVRNALVNIAQNDFIEFQICRPNETAKHISCSVYPFNNSSHKKIGRFLTFFDTTEYRKNTLRSERMRVSHDLHDSMGNSLNIISANLEYALNHLEGGEEMKECLQKSYDRTINAFLDLRRIVEALSPVDIEKNGLIWALEKMFNRLQYSGINIKLENHMADCSPISTYPYGDYIYFICQEAIHNAITHGRAKNIQIILMENADNIRLYISDDGTGCDKIIKGTGIKSMQHRVDSLGGYMEYGSPSDGGFNIKIILPINSHQPQFVLREKKNDSNSYCG